MGTLLRRIKMTIPSTPHTFRLVSGFSRSLFCVYLMGSYLAGLWTGGHSKVNEAVDV